ncbi:hypothetical protein [Croceicoccus gelatinilyticus]|uniref:hypothetical protein n=1 Tax=Croceicoccus gelatinilyticus TaxID=2835536 RepID=UPI001BD1831F|nr:hypothetical protein [Croceicoccus gelatinilyticus]MBS7671448.1 hypothetical protein [Croceicoccus gelatinilyticus]
MTEMMQTMDGGPYEPDHENVAEPTELAQDRAIEILAKTKQVIAFFEATNPTGRWDEEGCALLAQLIEGEGVRFVKGNVGSFVIFPDLQEPGRQQVGYIKSNQAKGFWLEIDGHVLDPFTFERLQAGDPQQTKDWHPLPMVFRSIGLHEPADIVHIRTGDAQILPRHNSRYHMFNDWLARGGASRSKLLRDRPILMNSGLASIEHVSVWAKAAGLASLAIPPDDKIAFRQSTEAKPTQPEAKVERVAGHAEESEAAAASPTKVLNSSIELRPAIIAIVTGLALAALWLLVDRSLL